MPDATTLLALEGASRAFLVDTPARFGTLATINPDGTPHQAVVWYAVREDSSILLNSRVGRRWPSNLLRDPRCSIAVEAGIHWVAVRGVAEVLHEGDPAYRDIVALAWRYNPDDPGEVERASGQFRIQERISFLLRPRAVSVHL